MGRYILFWCLALVTCGAIYQVERDPILDVDFKLLSATIHAIELGFEL